MKSKLPIWLGLIAINLIIFLTPGEDAPSTQSAVTMEQADAPATEAVSISKKMVVKSHLTNAEKTIQQKVIDLMDCYKSQMCEFDRSDSRAYDLAVGQALKRELMRYEYHVQKNQIKSPEITRLAVNALAVPDGHVKEAALLLQVNQAPDPKALVAVLDYVIDYHDGELMPLAAAELSKYTSSEDQEIIHQRVLMALVNGGHLSRKALAQHLDRILTQDRLADYESILAKLPQGSDIGEIIQSKIEEFKRKSSGA